MTKIRNSAGKKHVPNATIVTAGDEIEAVLVDGEAGDSVQVGHHAGVEAYEL